MAENIVLDFLHNYNTGERRTADLTVYQYDMGRVLEAHIPASASSVELHYWQAGDEQSAAYEPISITANTEDGGYTVLGNIPNFCFEQALDLHVYVVVTDDSQDVTTYEGLIDVKARPLPDDYVDINPNNSAVRINSIAQALYEDMLAIGGTSTAVRVALLTLLSNAAYTTTGLDDEITVLQAWAETITAVSISPATISISGATTSQLIATTTPTGGSIAWSSSDTSIATVNSYGLVTGVGNGNVTITATCGGLSATCAVTVEGFPNITGITATYTQTDDVYETTALNDLKSDLVVVAEYDDSSTVILPGDDYALSGSLTVGTSTILVSYGGFTDTISVTVSEYVGELIYSLGETVFTDASASGITTEVTNSDMFTYAGTSLFIDFEETENNNTGEARVFWSNISSGNYTGTNITARVGHNYNFSSSHNGSSVTLPNTTPNTSMRIKAVMRIQTNEDRSTATITFDYSLNGERKTQAISTATYLVSGDSAILYIAMPPSASLGNNWYGTIHRFKIFNVLMTDDQVTSFVE